MWFLNQVSYRTTDGKDNKSDIGNSRKWAVCVLQKEQAGQGQHLRLDSVRESFTRSPQKSTCCVSRELQQDGAPPYFHLEVRRHLNTTLPQRWIGCTSNEDSSIPLYLSAGLDVRLTKTPHLFPGLPGHPTSLHVTFSSGAMLKIKFTCPIYQSFNRELWLQLIPSMLICCILYGKS
jgi:hypothetical protein